jgi:alkylation response protein AidB-like acyl-CoA dehydrogenase
MEFSWTVEQRTFRERVRGFLHKNLPPDWETIAGSSPGSKRVTDFSREFCPKLAASGLLVPHWPERYGGRAAPPWEHFILGGLMWEAGEPRGPQCYNVNWIGPTIMAFGSPEQAAAHLPPMAAGAVFWCQGFSEPSAGSDLAALRTTAERRPGGFVIGGTKTWIAYAARADFCFLLAKVPGPEGGITVFLVPMDRAGVTVRPIPSVVGDGDLHEVFFDSVEVRDDEVLGGVGKGWQVARYALNYERVGIPRYALASRVLRKAVARLKAADEFTAAAQERAALAHAACEAARMLTYSVVDRRSRDLPADSSTSVARFATLTSDNAVAEFVLDFQPQMVADGLDPMGEAQHRRAITAGITSGAAEIQLNLIARGALGLGRRNDDQAAKPGHTE